MAGDYILAIASIMTAQLQNDDVTLTLTQVNSMNHTSKYAVDSYPFDTNKLFSHKIANRNRKKLFLIHYNIIY